MPSESVHMEVSAKSLFYMNKYDFKLGAIFRVSLGKQSEDLYIEIGHEDMWTYADLTTNECSSDYL